LYSAAWNTSWQDFWHLRRPIGMLAFGLVICTAGAVAWVSHQMIPGFPLALGFLLGGIVSPPDAVAATSVAQGTALACLLRAGHRHGLRLSRATLVVPVMPLALYGGAIAGLTATALLALTVWRGGFFDRWERAQLVGVLRRRAG